MVGSIGYAPNMVEHPPHAPHQQRRATTAQQNANMMSYQGGYQRVSHRRQSVERR